VFYPSLASANLPITVLKFGGSVLSGLDALTVAVAEVKRTLRSGSRVVVVTSAFTDVTERLLSNAEKQFRSPAEKPLASLLATGESRSAAFVSLALDDARISNELLDPARIGFTVRGSWLDSEPVDVDLAAIHKAFGRAPVIVVPGFFGRRPDGATALLGRGGADLTALFLAERLSARECRLIKDVDGLFSHDPRSGVFELHRYGAASWDELESVGGGLVQPKAIAFAREHEVPFTISAPLSQHGTTVAGVAGVAS